VYGATPPETVAATVPETTPGLLRLKVNEVGLSETVGCAGVVNVMSTLAVFAFPCASWTVTCQRSVKFSAHAKLAENVGLATVVFEIELRVPAVRTQL
jgi:hypothetical protein